MVSPIFTVEEVKARAIHPLAWYAWIPENFIKGLPYNTPYLIAYLSLPTYSPQLNGYVAIDKDCNVIINESGFNIIKTESSASAPFLGAEKIPPEPPPLKIA